ncbi:MAG TPA: hypothetical protein VIH35_04150, partial [Kiritimatiellia bacterium]
MKRGIFWLLLVSSLAACILWLFVVPYHPDRLYKAIPAQATVVSAHANLAGRWDDLRANPVTASFLATLGVETGEVETLSAGAAFRGWLGKLASDELVVAYVPNLGPAQQPAWIVASWIGGRSQRLRWMLSTQKSLKPETFHRYPMWTFKPAGWKRAERVRFTLAEGMAIACISRDPGAVYEVLACLDGANPSLHRRDELMLSPANRGAADRGWVRTSHDGVYALERVAYAFDVLDARNIKGSVSIPYSLPAAAAPGADVAELGKVWGSRPLAWILADKAIVMSWLGAYWRHPWATGTIGLIAKDAQGPLALGLFGDPFSGRWKGLKLPTLMAGGSVVDGATAVADVREKLDTLNARYKWGLVPRELDVGSRKVCAIVSTDAGLYSFLAPNEQVGYTAGTNWLLFASNVEGLSNLLVAADAEQGASAPSKMTADAPVSGWVNLAEGGKALRLAITAYAFKVGLQDPRGS